MQLRSTSKPSLTGSLQSLLLLNSHCMSRWGDCTCEELPSTIVKACRPFATSLGPFVKSRGRFVKSLGHKNKNFHKFNRATTLRLLQFLFIFILLQTWSFFLWLNFRLYLVYGFWGFAGLRVLVGLGSVVQVAWGFGVWGFFRFRVSGLRGLIMGSLREGVLRGVYNPIIPKSP